MNKYKFIFLILFTGLLFVFPGQIVAANSIEKAISKYKISFPIAELGNCANFSECRTYCENSSNRDTCVSYAKKKGFYKEEETDKKKDEIISLAQNELNCSSMSDCKRFCENEGNFERCTEFAKKHGLGGGQMLSPRNQDILNKAKSILGCDSPSSCKAICQDQASMDKCKSFFQSVGLKVEEGSKKGPGGCDSPESCQAYCSDKSHADECDSFGPDPEGKSTRRKDAIKACENLGPDECKNYCMQNPNNCPGFWAEGGYKGPDYESGEEYCKENPSECPGPGAEDEMRNQSGKTKQTTSDTKSETQSQNPAVQGISTIRSYFEIVNEFIKDLLLK